jgi:hypothetical protein
MLRCGRRVPWHWKSVQEPARSRQGVVQVLPWLAQPEAVVGARLRLRNEDVEGQGDQGTGPAGPPAVRLPPHVGLKRRPVRIAVVVEGEVVPDGDDVIASVAFGRLYPQGFEAGVRIRSMKA